MSKRTELATALIKGIEGCEKRMPDGRLRSYPDPGTGGAPWTIGFGSTGPDIIAGTVWTQEQADRRLEQDVAKAAASVDRLVTVPLTDEEAAALTSFVYNLGAGQLANSTLLRLLNAGKPRAEVANQFKRWVYGGGRVLPGLVTRRDAEAALFLTTPEPAAPAGKPVDSACPVAAVLRAVGLA